MTTVTTPYRVSDQTTNWVVKRGDKTICYVSKQVKGNTLETANLIAEALNAYGK